MTRIPAGCAGEGHVWLDWANHISGCACCLLSSQVGGGDQLYCDQVFELPALKPWLAIDDPHVSTHTDWSAAD